VEREILERRHEDGQDQTGAAKEAGDPPTGCGVAPEHERVERYVWDQDRAGNKAASADAAMRLVIEWLEAT